MKTVYVLKLDNYNEWAWENGASNLIAVSPSLDKIINTLKKWYLENDYLDGCIFNDHETIETIIKDIKEKFNKGAAYASVDVYTNELNYDNGMNMGTYTIEKVEVL